MASEARVENHAGSSRIMCAGISGDDMKFPAVFKLVGVPLFCAALASCAAPRFVDQPKTGSAPPLPAELRDRSFVVDVRVDERAAAEAPARIPAQAYARLLDVSLRRGWSAVERAGARQPPYAVHVVIERMRIGARKWWIVALASVLEVRMEIAQPGGGRVLLGRWTVRQPSVAVHAPAMLEPNPPLQPLLGDAAQLFPAAAAVALDVLADAQAGVPPAAFGRSIDAAPYLEGNRYGITPLSEGEVIDILGVASARQ